MQNDPHGSAAEWARCFEVAAAVGGLGIWRRDPVTGDAWWNGQMYAITGRAPELGAPSRQEWVERIVHPLDRPQMLGAREIAALAAEELVRLEYRIVRPDGQTRWLESRFRQERHDGVPMIVGVTLDTTERHQVQDALRSADERAALAARAAGIGTWEVDLDGNAMVLAERWDAQMFHLRGLLPREQAPTRQERLALVHPDDRQRTVDADASAVAGAGAQSYEFRVCWPDGQQRWLASRSISVQGERGQTLRRVGVNWDVTEARDAAAARHDKLLAERDSRAKSQFLSRMSHELRTPLNAVLGFTELLHLEATQAQASSQLVKLGHIRAAGEHLLALINDVLELSGVQSGQVTLASQAVDLAPLAAAVLPLVGALARRHAVTVHCGPLALAVRGDPRRLRQVLLNLLTNAIKYNRPGGGVWIDAAAQGDAVLLRVRDNGRGLDAQQLERLFEPFNQLGTDRDHGGASGIGLVIAKALVEAMGGHIGASSGVGQGTQFELTLPAAVPAAAASSDGVAAPENDAGPRGAGQLVYIEDNAVNVLLVEEMVGRHTALRLESAGTGAAGVALARRLQPDLVLIDMQLPDCDGFEVLRRLRADPATCGLRCVALSANAMADDIERALAAGFAAYWTKPIDFNRFLLDLQAQMAAARGEPSAA